VESDVLQMVSVLGALAILEAYAASQFDLVDTSKLSYQVANFQRMPSARRASAIDQGRR
jgi:hypothetical protein